MRFNAKEIAAVASQPSYKFEKEGVLFIKERQEGLFRRNDVFTERWCRLRGNLFFYYKTKDPCSEPVGVIVLERHSVKDGPISGGLYCFTIAFEGDELAIHMAAQGSSEREAWTSVLRDSSYERVREEVQILRARLLSRQRESDPGLYSGSSCKRSQDEDASSSNKKDPLQNEPFLELGLACDNLRCDADGQAPNPLVVVLTGRPRHGLWSKFAQTEVVEKSSNPCFLTTVGFLKKQACATTEVKLCVYDVRERVTSTKTLLGEATFALGTLVQMPGCFLRLALISPSYENVGFVTVTARELEPELTMASKKDAQDLFWPTADRRRTYSLPACMPRRACTPLHAQLRIIFDGLSSKTYRFHTGLGAELRVHEIMAESKLSFSFPQLLLNLWINEEKQLMDTVTHLRELSPEWQAKQLLAIERHLLRINTYSEALENLAKQRGAHFKPSRSKGLVSLEFAPVNMHLQRLWVHNTTSHKKCVYDVVTVGAFTAYAQKFLHGGLYKLLNQLKNAYPLLQREGQPSILGPDRLSTAAQAVLSIEHIREDIEADVQQLMQLADLKDIVGMEAAATKISDKAKQLTTLCNPLLVDEALTIWEGARLIQPNNDISSAGKTSPKCSLRPPPVARLKSASLPREFPAPPGASSGSPSDESSGDEAPIDSLSVNGNVCSAQVRPMPQLHKSDSMYSTEESRFSGLSEEFEPLDLTHLNIRASIMCMVGRVQHLAHADDDQHVDDSELLDPLTPCSTPGDMSPWQAELAPSVRKLRQSMACLQKVARFTYALLSLKEPPPSASLSYCVRQRRDICFSHALTSLVAGLMSKLWCQQTDPLFVHCLTTFGVLAQFTGLLSCHGDELAMLEDMVVTIDDLRRVAFWLEPATNVCSPKPRVEGSRVFLSVLIPTPETVMARVPHRGRFQFSVVPVFFNVGINEQATLAEKVGDQSFQERINLDGAASLKEYHKQFQKFPMPKHDTPRARSIQPREVPLMDVIEQLQTHVRARKSKDVEILHLAMEACRRMRGLRFTSCKSAKDRTGMCVTLEQGQILLQDFGLDSKEVPRAVACMRSEGTRRHNTFKNVGVRKYAFNSLQMMALPRQYRPPPGTFGNVQS
ncbi:inositol polyphosphate-4-phosphatase type I A isoform X2 [Rhipicephalus sanguineus]|uniref:inositol polyphosphate-4-phosphatase type I A isoform X2 n=1 Tax=Rhipicephalus sanguineus TaxID=34632 RepID=UPI001893B085|nr:inositol polyphosphate-4-phosphatase type I A isoform X2 [Rhipicephalus sanguineus]